MGSILSVIADILGIIGAVVAAWAALRAKSAADQARDAAWEVTRRIATLDTLTDASAAIELIAEIRTLHRLGDWTLVLDRYTTLRRRLVRISKADIADSERSKVARSRAHFRIIEAKVESAKAAGSLEGDEFVKIMGGASDQIDILEGVLMDIRKQGVLVGTHTTA